MEKDGKIVFIGSLVNVEVLFFDVVKFDFEGWIMMLGYIDFYFYFFMVVLILRMDFIILFDWIILSGMYKGVRI